MATTAKKSNPTLWSKVVSSVKSGSKGGNAGQWSARKAHIAVKKYKENGGGYQGKKSESNSLKKWTDQKWKTKSGKPSLETGERYLPEKAIKSLSKKEYESTTKAKREGLKKGKQFVAQPKKIKNKTSKFR